MKLGPFHPGDPIPRESAFYTACGQAAAAHLATQTRLSGRSVLEFVPSNAIAVKNNTGGALDRGAIIGIGETVITPTQSEDSFRSGPVFYASTPAVPDHLGKWAVLAEPLRTNGVGWAVSYGAWPVEVEFAYSDEPYADIKASTTANLQGAEGGCRVLWKESGTGVKWAVVMLGHSFWPILQGKLDANLNAGSSAAMSVWEGATLSDSSRNVTVYDRMLGTGKKIASTTVITASWTSGKWYVLTSAACEVAQ